MAYTILGDSKKSFNDMLAVRTALLERLDKSKIFRAELSEITFFSKTYKGYRNKTKEEGYGFTISNVYLKFRKSYCGNHPGVCYVKPGSIPKKKPVNCLLEWDDWVKFNNWVNALLNKMCKKSSVWSLPPDAKGVFWIRKDNKPRKIYSFTEDLKNPAIKYWDRGLDPIYY